MLFLTQYLTRILSRWNANRLGMDLLEKFVKLLQTVDCWLLLGIGMAGRTRSQSRLTALELFAGETSALTGEFAGIKGGCDCACNSRVQ